MAANVCIMAHMFSRPSPGLPRFRAPIAAAGLWALVASTASAQSTAAGSTSQDDPTLRFRMPTVIVTAQKEPADKQKVPVSVTAVSKDTLDAMAARIVSDAAILAPNTFFTEWTARKLSNARFRGISSSPNNPGITTYIDGVPQLNANSSSVELLDVEQIEFVRGPQSALFGRNTLGGLVSVATARPSHSTWTGSLSAPFGNHGAWAVRGGASGPLVRDRLSLGVSFAEVKRAGYTVNDVTGNDIDDRSAFSAKAQLLWTPAPDWEARVIFSGERARDGDYALQDVGALRANPFHASRNFEGFANRDVVQTTVQARRNGKRITFASTTGFVNWKTQDVTDLDYTAAPLITRDNTEKDFQFTQEVRVASAEAASIQLSDSARLRWQGGASLFTQGYEQEATNAYAANFIAPFPLSQTLPRSELDDVGVGLFGQGTVTFDERFDVSLGARFDYEHKSALLEIFFTPQIAAPTLVDTDDGFSNVSPQLAVAYRPADDRTFYATVGGGYKAGGFNAASPAGRESYGEEKAWHFEGGAKTAWAEGRVAANVAVFYIDWSDLQLNVPNPAVPAQFYVSNVGGAISRGVELEVSGKAAPGLDLFTAFGYTHARFGDGSVSSGVDVEDNELPYTPDYTFSVGGQYTRALGAASLTARGDLVWYGAFQYNDQNTMGQDAYSLVNLRVAVTARRITGELFVRNAFDTKYIPIAFPYPSFAPSGFMGEMGAPRTIGVGIGVRF
jgi:iron complex outermembrane receptor protein